MVWSASTDSFLLAFDHFVATRGMPEYVTSDRGGNFVAGEQELRELLTHWNQTYGRAFKWVFNPAYSPEQGGNYKRLIRSLKQAMYHTMETTKTILTDEELMTAFKHVERLINQRPLTIVSEDPRDPVALTPFDFLVGSRDTIISEAERPIPCTLEQRWHVLQNLTRKLWREFVSRYLRNLHKREKWTNKQTPFREQQVVLVLKPTTQKGHWPLAVIEKVHLGRRNQVRSVEIRTADGERITRGPSGIAPIAEVEADVGANDE